jgi:hypothetical protein
MKRLKSYFITMSKTRDNYSEELNHYYQRMLRAHNEVLKDFQDETRSKSAEQMLDSVHDFFFFGYHLREWVQKDEKVPQEVKLKIPPFEGEGATVQFMMCRDLCNKSKHAVLQETSRYKPNDVNTKIHQYGGGVYKISIKELNETNQRGETLHAQDKDMIFLGNFLVIFRGKNYDLKGVVEGCMYYWQKFFEENDLLLPRSTPFPK